MIKKIFAAIALFFFAGCNTKAPVVSDSVVAITPALTEVVLDLGAGDRLIATSVFTTDPRAQSAIRIQEAGNLETIIALKPGVVFMQPTENQLGNKLEKMGVKTVSHAMNTLDDIEDAILVLGKNLDKTTQAQALIRQMRQDLEENKRDFSLQGAPHQALIIVDRLDARMQQFYIAQKPAFLVDLTEGCGIQVLSPGTEYWTRIDAEKLIQLNPESIVYFE